MPDTDRKKIKDQQEGTYVTAAGISDPHGAVVAMHTRTVCYPKVGTENADTNVAETLMFRVGRKSKPTIYYTSPLSATANATHYTLITVTRKTAGVDAGIVGTWNTHTSAQGAFTSNVPFALTLNTGVTLLAGDTLHYIKRTVGDGRSIGVGSFTFELEEI
jgi:hypothetical protein